MNKKKLKIVFICNEYPPGKSGGIGVFTKKLAEGLVEAGHDIYVVGLYSDIGERIEENINGVRVARYPAKHGRLGLILNRLVIYKQLKKISLIKPIDIIETPDFEAAVAYLPKVARKNITRLHGSHTYFSSEANIEPSLIIKHLEGKQLKKACKVVSVSQYTAKETQRLFKLPDEPVVIYNSVDIDKFSSKAKINYSTCKRVIYFGTLVEKKGIYPLAQAWRQFYIENPDWVLTVVGKDAYESGCSNKDKMLSMLGAAKESVEFIEHVENEILVSSLKDYDFAILPSFSEAFALAPLEAMAAGLPVIISNMSSGPELVEHGIDGWLCDPRKPETLVEMINKAAESEDVRKSIADAAIKKINSNFNFQSFLKNNINFYKKLLLS